MKSIGIDIGSHSIKLVEVVTTNKGFIVSRAQERFLSLKTNQDPEIEVIEILNDLVGKEDPTTTMICAALPQERVILRHKIFPFKDRFKIAKSLPFELEEEIPMSAEQTIFDAKTIRYVGDTSEVIAAAVTKTQIGSFVSKLQDAGAKPNLVTAEGLAFSNVFEAWSEAPPQLPPVVDISEETIIPKGLKVILNIGFQKTLVLAFERDRLIGVRTILWGGKQIADAIAKKYELPFYEAKKEMELKGFILPSKSNASFDAKIFSDTISKSVRELVRDLQLTFLELKTEFKCEIDQLFLTGGVSPLRGLGAFLTIQLDIPVNPIGIYSKFPQIAYNTTDFPEQRFGVALGIAIEGIKKPRNPAIQFLRNEFAQQNNFFSKVIQTYGRTLVYASVLFGLFLSYGFARQYFAESAEMAAEDNLKEQAVKSAKITRRQATAQGIQRYIRDTKKRSSEIKVLSNVVQMNSALDVMKRISETVPGKTLVTMDLHTLRIIDENVEMHGYVKTENEVRSLQQELSKMSMNGKINVNEPKLPALVEKTAFSFTFKTDRNLNSSKE